MLVLGLTGPGIVPLAPLFAVRAWQRDTRWSFVLAILAGVCGAIQFGFIQTHPLPPEPAEYIKPALALPVLGNRMIGSLFFGGHLPLDGNHGLLAALGVATVVFLLALGLWPGSSRRERIFLSASCLLLLGATLYRMRYELPQTLERGFGSRYFYAPQLMMIWLLIVFLQNGRRSVRIGAAALLVLALAANVRRLHEPTLINQHWANYAAKIRNHEPVTVPLNPQGWQMTLNKKDR
jgi:hypothetical protein